MLIYALTGQVWTIQLIRAVPTILFWKTEPTEDSRVGEQHNMEQQNQQYRTKDKREKRKNTQTYKVTNRRVYASMRKVAKHARHAVTKEREELPL